MELIGALIWNAAWFGITVDQWNVPCNDDRHSHLNLWSFFWSSISCRCPWTVLRSSIHEQCWAWVGSPCECIAWRREEAYSEVKTNWPSSVQETGGLADYFRTWHRLKHQIDVSRFDRDMEIQTIWQNWELNIGMLAKTFWIIGGELSEYQRRGRHHLIEFTFLDQLKWLTEMVSMDEGQFLR
jgi:hypothetical protein